MRTRILAAAGVVLAGHISLAHADSQYPDLAFENFSEYPDGTVIGGNSSATPPTPPAIPSSPSFGFDPAGYHETGLDFGTPGPIVRPGPVTTSQVVSDGKSVGGGFNRLFLSLAPTVATYAATHVTYLSFIGGADFATQIDLNKGGDADTNRVAEFAVANDTSTTGSVANPAQPNAGTTLGEARAILINGSTSGEDQLSLATAEGKPAGSYDDTSSPFLTPTDPGTGLPETIYSDNEAQTNPTPADFFVIKIDPIKGQITYSVFLNGNRPDPSLPTFAPSYTATIDGANTGYDEVGIFDVYSPYTAGISDIRIGTTFASVTPLAPILAPEPASLGLVAASAAWLVARRRRSAAGQ